MRAVHDLKYEGFEWPINGEGNPLFKLVDLAKAQNVAHENAHDALYDVRATIGLARKVARDLSKTLRMVITATVGART